MKRIEIKYDFVRKIKSNIALLEFRRPSEPNLPLEYANVIGLVIGTGDAIENIGVLRLQFDVVPLEVITHRA